ncbi:MAG: hypothetical protein A2Y97_07835 [Nitrospirae bacterium RBG_13_39_12]|nr:MAG: hypothetical protein A2Y97_07835 [Nitrospirae bacterium RBG_13_39_12]
MTLKDYRQTYYTFSGKASNVARQLSFAGIAIIWIFKTVNSNQITVPVKLISPLIFFTISLASDLLHYIAGTIIWGLFQRHHEIKSTDSNNDPVLSAPRQLNWPTNFFFTVKLISVIIAYYLLLKYFVEIWHI